MLQYTCKNVFHLKLLLKKEEIKCSSVRTAGADLGLEKQPLLNSFTIKMTPNRLWKLEAQTKNNAFKFQVTQTLLRKFNRMQKLKSKLFAWLEHASSAAMKENKIALQVVYL